MNGPAAPLLAGSALPRGLAPSGPDARPVPPRHAGRRVADLLAGLIPVLAIAWVTGLFTALGVQLYAQQYLAALLGLSLAVIYLAVPARRAALRTRVPVHDWLLAALSLLVLGYVALRYPDLVLRVFLRPVEVWLPGALTIALLFEALRRVTGWALPLILAAFVGMALIGDLLPLGLELRPQEWRLLSGYMGFDANAVLGLPLSVAGGVIVVFLLLGTLLGTTGGTRFFTDVSIVLMGRFRGGSMKIAVLASALFGSVSGSAVANVLSTGTVTIPMIKDDGFPPEKAAGIEAAASTGGQLAPPVMGAAAFLMAEFLEVPYAEVAFAALLPALLFYAALFIQADIEAQRLNLPPMPSSNRPPLHRLLNGWHFPATFAVLIYLLFWRGFQPDRAGLWAALTLVVTGMVFGYGGTRPGPRQLVQALSICGHRTVEITVIAAGAGVVIGVLGITGLGFNLPYALVELGGGSPVALLALAALVCIVLGMGLPTLGVYVLLAALVAPALVETGVPAMAAHLYVLYFGMMSMITPPVALAAFAAASIAGAAPMRSGWYAMRFGWSAYVVPVLFVLSPSLLMMGPWQTTLWTMLGAFAGIWAISQALVGGGIASGRMARIGLGLAGAMLLIPSDAFAYAWATDPVGLLVAGLVVTGKRRHARRAPVARPDLATD